MFDRLTEEPPAHAMEPLPGWFARRRTMPSGGSVDPQRTAVRPGADPGHSHIMKLAFITPRYGADITSGAEHACRLLAEQVCERHDVDVLTTCARDSVIWENEIAEGADRVRGVLVRRFAVSQPHDRGRVPAAQPAGCSPAPHSRADELEWVRRLGPWSPGLIDFLKRQHRSYDALVFFSLLHPTTVHGLHDRAGAQRPLSVPAAAAGAALRALARGARRGRAPSAASRRASAVCCAPTCAPRRSTRRSSASASTRRRSSPIRGTSRTRPTTSTAEGRGARRADEPAETVYLEGRGIPFRRRHRLYGRFAVYGGRVEPDNGCEEMLEYFDSYAATDAAMPRWC